jgi:hypothetical protein
VKKIDRAFAMTRVAGQRSRAAKKLRQDEVFVSADLQVLIYRPLGSMT